MVGPGFNRVEVDNIWKKYKLDNNITCFTYIWQSLSRYCFSFSNFLFVVVQVLLFHDQSYEIHYEYTVSLNTTQDKSSEKQRELEYLYIWTHSSWQDCTVQCGGGKTHHTHSRTYWDIAGCENDGCKSKIWIGREKIIRWGCRVTGDVSFTSPDRTQGTAGRPLLLSVTQKFDLKIKQ